MIFETFFDFFILDIFKMSNLKSETLLEIEYTNK